MSNTRHKGSFVDKVTKAKTNLVLDHPFIGNIALGFTYHIVSDEEMIAYTGKSVLGCVNGKTKEIRLNENTGAALGNDEIMFLIAHECMHPMFEHHVRIGKRDPELWNIAGDYVINQFLSDGNIGKMPDMGLLDKEIFEAGGGTTEGIYAYLEGAKDPSTVEGAEALDVVISTAGTPAEQEGEAAKWKLIATQAAQAARMAGKLSENEDRLVGELTKVQVDWREVLMRFVERQRADIRSWSRFNRRFLSQRMYLPGMSGEVMGELVIAIDCSGSISEGELNQFATEIMSIKETYNPRAMHIIYFESEVSGYDVFSSEEDLVITPRGCGGTAFSPVFKHIHDNDIEPCACVVLTDLGSTDFGDAPYYPVLWVTTDETEAPFGEIVPLTIN